MHKFMELIEQLDSTTSTNEKAHFIAAYFKQASAGDAAWALFFLSGHRLKRFISSPKLWAWCMQETKIPPWLIEECYAHVGDSAELIALLIQEKEHQTETRTLSQWMDDFILPLKDKTEEEQRQLVTRVWKRQTRFERFLMNKILGGSFRLGVSALITVKGLSQAFDIPLPALNIKLAGEWQPTADFFTHLISEHTAPSNPLNPYPFFLAAHMEGDPEQLGDPHLWMAEWKWDGIRAQIIQRTGGQAIWSRGNELITRSFPELIPSTNHTFVVDGEILAFQQERPLPFSELQKRLGRKAVTKGIQEKYPVHFMVYDLLEWDGEDLRHLPYQMRRELLHTHRDILLAHPLYRLPPAMEIQNWEQARQWRADAIKAGTEGLIFKRKDSSYGSGRKRGFWWKYKVESMTIDAVLIYAQPGSGYRSGLYTDYTFGIWDNGELVPIAKAYSGLTQAEIREVDKWVRRETLEKFGPVRRVKPELVFELAFENIQESKRHKAGLAVRFPRIKRQRQDRTAETANTLDDLRQLLKERLSHGTS